MEHADANAVVNVRNGPIGVKKILQLSMQFRAIGGSFTVKQFLLSYPIFGVFSVLKIYLAFIIHQTNDLRAKRLQRTFRSSKTIKYQKISQIFLNLHQQHVYLLKLDGHKYKKHIYLCFQEHQGAYTN